MLISEEINLTTYSAKIQSSPNPSQTLYTTRNTRDTRGRSCFYQNSTNKDSRNPPPSCISSTPTICQICNNRRHTANNCWYHMNINYNPTSTSSTPKAFMSSSTPPNEWLLDSKASSHLTPIHHTGHDLLPTPTCKLLLPNLLHAPHISHNLLSIYKLARGNNLHVSFI
ncbi:hypothetical protein MA16_Dca025265 [Dendrobium catenatum]|uniref:Uncharacterized protein n=1 Tax=Dendrobium catenatum TaxID=906689 RepID=A0A2I0WY72_9ASPA|nr:hypothetical protein MA16_Dca025265 [Dendrobium catenatum]